ncbi:hypothetical protein JR316_0006658 [Psilocybe cubensis]|uniref:CHAT domain-containing protein n=2 Tax=Psilocybe cubensis TaxID=181762 RepID=A0A8H8CEB9_PSICU|nr:hypothetical protein JR316_0006658 [Psilocybe cubensis]KAH9480061.1 hypothetical protein JR316_0006658 [Psilocybe cubensis]
MDTIVLRNLSILPAPSQNVPFDDSCRFEAHIVIEDVVHDETEAVAKESGVWSFEEEVLLIILQVDDHGMKNSLGTVDIITEQIQAPASQRETRFLVDISSEDDQHFFLNLSFTAYLMTSNVKKGLSPESVISVVKAMEMESIDLLLTQILDSDTSFMSADQGLLSTIYGTLLKHRKDDVHTPRSLALLANIYLARYDSFLNIVGDEPEKYPMYPVYNRGLKVAISMLESALSLAAGDHPKKQWMMISLCMCYQRQMVQYSSSRPSMFKNMTLRMYHVVLTIDDTEKQKPVLCNYVGVALANCFLESKEDSDLDAAIAAQENAIRLTSDSEPHIVSLLIDLIDVLNTRVSLRNTSGDTIRLLDVKKRFLRVTPDDNPRKIHLLMSLAHSLYSQFKETRTQSNIEESVALYEQALELLPEVDPLKPSVLNNLATSLAARGTSSDIDRLTQLIRDAIALTLDTDPNRVEYIKNLGNAIHSQMHQGVWGIEEFRRYTNLLASNIDALDEGNIDAIMQDLNMFTKLEMANISTDVILDDVLPHFRSFIMQLPDSCFSKSLVLFHLGSLLFRLFEQRRERLLIDQSIDLFEQSISSSAYSSRTVLWKNTLVQAYISKYVHFKGLSDLDQADNVLTMTLQPLPTDHGDRPYLLATLASLLYQRFLKDDDVLFLNRCITSYLEALRGLPEGVPQKFRWCSELGRAYMGRFDVLKHAEDIDKAIQSLKDASKGLMNDAQLVSECYMNLARSLFIRFNQTYQLCDLDDAVEYLEDPLSFSDLENVNNTAILEQRFYDLVEVFRNFSGTTDMDVCKEEMESLMGDTGLAGKLRLHNIGIFLSLRFESLQGSVDQNMLESISTLADSLPITDTHKARWLGMLLAVYIQQFDVAGDAENLDNAVFFCTESIQHCIISPNESSGPSSSYIRALTTALTRRFRRSGNLADLNKAISILDEAVSIRQDEDITKYTLLNDLGFSLMDRYDLIGDIDDFNKSAEAYNKALKLAPSRDNNDDDLQSNIGLLRLRRLKLSGDINDANDAVAFLKEHMERLPDEDTKKVDAVARYSLAVLDRYWHFRDPDDLNVAIVTLESALARLSEDSSQKASVMHDLGSALAQRYVQRSEIDDLNRCLSLYRKAQDILTEKNDHRYMLLFDIGRWLPVRYERLRNVEDLEAADAALLKASTLQSSPFRWRFRAASLRGYWCQSLNHGDPIKGYTTSMQLLPNLAWLGISIRNRQHQLLEVGEVVLDAVAAAIKATRYDLAFEWLEYGRSIIWSQILQLRAPTDSLSSQYPDIAQKFIEVSLSLANMEDENPSQRMLSVPRKTRNGSPRYHELADEREKLLEKIRGLDNFHDFLKPQDMSSLFRAASNGPVIAVNINKFRCDALVILPGQENIVLIPLDNFSSSEAYGLMGTMKSLIRRATRARGSNRGPRKRSPLTPKTSQDPEVIFSGLLAKLWTGVVKPILDGIGFAKNPDNITELPHIWWCLTGPLTMLPIHAAGIYEQDGSSRRGSKVSDYAVSSYIPSLGSLINCMTPRKNKRQNLVAISLPVEAGLPCSQAEVEVIQNLNDRFPVSTLIELEATRENVLNGMQSAGWVHFACHGIHNPNDPHMSALMLSGGGKLTLSDISKLSLPHAEFAFLSACQTATGDELLPEEAVHIAAGMLSAGYQSVVGTMWSIFDDDGPRIADLFYSYLFSRPKPDPTDSAYALHYALKTLREDRSYKASFFSWVPFIHYGL